MPLVASKESTTAQINIASRPARRLTIGRGGGKLLKFRSIALSCVFLFNAEIPLAQEVAEIVDGDTLQQDGVVYRLHGIDAPEVGQRCGDRPCGVDATKALAALIEGRRTDCEGLDTDSYGRVIARCMIGEIDVSRSMVLSGHAWAFLRFSADYAEAEQVARASRVGIWSSNPEPPWEYRARKWAVAEADAPEGCPIKGNISSNGRIYHPPWSPWYSRTKIDTAKGERWFCDEAEALAAGWRAPRWR